MGDDDILGGAENLEDGELWLPSDFFAMDDAHLSSNNTKSRASSYHCSASSSRPASAAAACMVDSQPLPAFQRFKPVARYGSTAVVAGGGGYDHCNCKTGSGWTGIPPVHRTPHSNPVQTQVETFIEQRAWTALQQRTRFALNRAVLTPNRSSGRGGTGVFLPRVSSNMQVATKDGNQNHPGGFRKGQRTANTHKIKPSPRKIMLNQRQDERCGYVTAAWVGLPNHRTYYRM